MMIRKPSVERNKNSCIEYYDLLNNMFIEIIKLENEILANREKIDILIYNIISQENNCSSRNNYLNVKRNVYNNVSYKYEDARIELLENRDIYEDYLKRELLTKKKDEAQETINKIDNIVRENIQCMCGNDEFLLKIKAANYAIYRLVNENRFLTKKNHYLTILKYIYKQENCCTPSSLWSGVAFVGKGGENQIYGEVNTHKKKYQNRENKLKDLNHNHKVYVNLTLWYSGGKYYYYKF